MNSIQFFKCALSLTMREIQSRLKEKRMVDHDRNWVVQYVDHALVGSADASTHQEMLYCILKVLREMGGLRKRKKGKSEEIEIYRD